MTVSDPEVFPPTLREVMLRPRWIALLALCLVVAGVFAWLGQWQLGRALLTDPTPPGATELPLPEPREHAGDHEAQREQRDPARPQHDLAECGREDLRVGESHPALYGATTTSTLWNSLRSEYPVVAIDFLSAPMRFAVPSATGAGPYRTDSRVVT